MLKNSRHGCRASSASSPCDSWSQGCELESHVWRCIYLKKLQTTTTTTALSHPPRPSGTLNPPHGSQLESQCQCHLILLRVFWKSSCRSVPLGPGVQPCWRPHAVPLRTPSPVSSRPRASVCGWKVADGGRVRGEVPGVRTRLARCRSCDPASETPHRCRNRVALGIFPLWCVITLRTTLTRCRRQTESSAPIRTLSHSLKSPNRSLLPGKCP